MDQIPKYVDDATLTWEERYKWLNEHHIKETKFLIDKIREIVMNLLDEEK